MLLKAEIYKEIDKKVESDDFLKSAEEVSYIASGQIKDTQIKNLQNIINSTTRFGEIINFVKSQTGRHQKGDNNWVKLGPALLDELYKIDGYAKEIAEDCIKKIAEDYAKKNAGKKPEEKKEPEKYDPDELKGQIRLELCRHWIKIVLADFLYNKR